MPIGSMIIGTVRDHVENFAEAKDMEDTWCFELDVWKDGKPTGRKALFPVTGMIMNAIETRFFNDNPKADPKTKTSEILEKTTKGRDIAVVRGPDKFMKKRDNAKMFNLTLAIKK